MNISVFGGSQPKPGESAYDDALSLGRLLGSAGHTVLTGGYIGTMEAVSQGASQEGAHVIGITCSQIESWRAVRPNPWIIEERRFEYLYQRILALVESCDAAIALPGGAGTLTEVAVMWNLMLTTAISPRPLILVGGGWKTTFRTFFNELGGYTPVQYRKLLLYASDINDGFEMLEASLPD